MIAHLLLEERCAKDIPGQILHRFFVPGQNSQAAVHVESRMFVLISVVFLRISATPTPILALIPLKKVDQFECKAIFLMHQFFDFRKRQK